MTHSAVHRSRAALARSWLLTAAADPSAILAAGSSNADVVVLDLEDGVADRDKNAAREHTHRWLEHGNPVWVRINEAGTEQWSLDLEMLAATPHVAGVMLAKVEDAEQVEATAAHLGHGVPIVALIESALGLEEARVIARASSTLRLAFGSGDFRKDTGASDEPLALAYARSRLVVTSRAERIAPPIDGPTLTYSAGELRAGIAVGLSAGMTGKLCLLAAQTPLINAALSPSSAEITWADNTIARLGEDGAHVRNGSERPQLARALRIRHRAHAFSD